MPTNLQIGPYLLDNPVILAPMVGVTDRPFRNLCRRLGAGLVVGEMLSADMRLWNNQRTQRRLSHSDDMHPKAVQIAGGDPEMLREAAIACAERGAQMIDINMGCPAKNVCKKAAGSALMKDVPLVRSILETVPQAVEVPVTLKMRTGWAPEHRNAPEIAQIAEQNGISMLTIHGRTRACRFRGDAEYQTIAEVKRLVSIPVIANGDIDTPQKARAVMRESGADGVMIGRAAQGRPWLLGQIAEYLQSGNVPAEPAIAEIETILTGHVRALHEFYGEHNGVRIARKHVGWYLHNRSDGVIFRRRFNQLESAPAQLEAIEEYFFRINDPKERAA